MIFPSTKVYKFTILDYVVPKAIIFPALFIDIRSAVKGTLVHVTMPFSFIMKILLFSKSILVFLINQLSY